MTDTIRAYSQAIVIPGTDGRVTLTERPDGDGLTLTVAEDGGKSVTIHLDVWGAATLIGRYHKELDDITYRLKLDFPEPEFDPEEVEAATAETPFA